MEFKTSTQRARQGWMVKPSELVDIVEKQEVSLANAKVLEMRPLSLQDRRIYNELIHNAWSKIEEDVWHAILMKDIRGRHNVNDRVKESILKLRSTFIELSVRHENGEKVVEAVSLLDRSRFSTKRDGLLYYKFSAEMRTVIRNSVTWTKLQRDVLRSFESRYALVTYEMVQMRANLQLKTHEDFTLAEIRAILGVKEGALSEFSNLKQRALDPAAREVSRLSDMEVTYTPLKTPGSRAVTGVRVSWRRRPNTPELPGLAHDPYIN